ncbi:MAG TPA: histidine kinase, partial [Burkholderiaceae bacterium]
GQHAWEPFLWELSSAALNGPLSLLIYRWHVAGLGKPATSQWTRHLAAAPLFMLAHVSGMFAIRFAVYAMAGVHYDAGSPTEVLAYEAGKDLVTYTLIVAISHGIHLLFETQALRAELAEARLARLAEQVQPHFLFNTLNLISSVMYEDVARADRILTDLATLLRQTLSAQQQTLQSLDAELALVEPYLAIMQARFGARLTVSIHATPEARRCQVPALLLLSPVENAIKHDVALSAGAVEVRVDASLAQGLLRLSVENSGTAPERDARDGAIGLANVRERVAALYGARATVSLLPRAEGGSRLLIELPA